MRSFDELLAANTHALAAATTPTQRCELLCQRAVLLARHHDLAGADAALASARTLCRPAGSPTRLRLQLTEAIVTSFHNRIEAAIDQLGGVIDQLQRTAPPALHAEARSLLALLLVRAMDAAAAVRHARLALALAPAGEHDTRYQASLAAALGLSYAGMADAARPHFEHALAAAAAADNELAHESARSARTIAAIADWRQRQHGRLASDTDARALLQTLRDDLRRDAAHAVHVDLSAERVFEAELLLALGDIDSAGAIVGAQLDALVLEGLPPHESLAWAIRARHEAWRGQARWARSAMQRAESLVDQMRAPEMTGPVLTICADAMTTLGDRSRERLQRARADAAWIEVGRRQQAAQTQIQQPDDTPG